ncbi:MAG: restriction endonuclease subunit S [Bacillota bacterium]
MLHKLPTSWVQVRLGQICRLINGDRGKNYPSRTAFVEQGIPFINAGHLINGCIDMSKMNFISNERFEVLQSGKVQDQDVLFCLRGSLGKTAIVNGISKGAIASSLVIVRPIEGTRSRYVHYFLSSPFAERLIGLFDNGTAQPNLSAAALKRFNVPLAPLREQDRIIAKVEELFSDLDAGVAALERVRANLKRYRAAVLKAAVEGRLTEAWRRRNPPAESADKLLARILADRRKKWEEDQFRRYAEAGKTPPKDWREKYPVPVMPNVANHRCLPSEWCWATVDQLAISGPQNGAYYPKSLYGSGTPIIRIDDFQNDWSRSTDMLQLVECPERDCQAYGLSEGDMLINRVNSMTHLGKCLVIEERHVPSIFESNMMRVRLADAVVVNFIAHYLRSNEGKAQLTSNAKWAVNQASINQKDVLCTPVPLPPTQEQEEIVAEIDRRLSVAKAVEVEVECALRRAVRLRQAILKRAFEGTLVPQDPSDEPANALLESIRIEQQKPETDAKKGPRPKRQGERPTGGVLEGAK